jgi:hypothetical protein
MQSTAKKATDDPHDFVVVPSDQVRVAPSGAEAVAPSDAEITGLLRAAARHRSDSGSSETPDRSGSAPVLAVDTTFRATAVNDEVRPRGTTFARRAMRAVVALLLAICIGAAALTWQTFGYTAKKAVLKWMPKFALTASLPLDKLGFSTNATSGNEPAVADATPDQAASSAQSTAATPENGAPEKAVANPAAPSSDQAQLMQSMARDLANLGQEVEILKASIAELKANQQKPSDKASEQNAKAKMVTAPPPRPSAIVAARRPAPLYSPTATSAAPPPAYRSAPSSYSSQPTQAAVAPPVPPPAAQPYVPPPVPLQSQVEPGFTSVPRPPMPVQQP